MPFLIAVRDVNSGHRHLRARRSANCTWQRAHQVGKFLLHGVPLGCEISGQKCGCLVSGVWSLEERWRVAVRSAECAHIWVDIPMVSHQHQLWYDQTKRGILSGYSNHSTEFPWRHGKLLRPCRQPVPVVSASIVPRPRLKTQALGRPIVSGLSLLPSAARFHAMLPPISASFFGDYTEPGSTSESLPTVEGG
jgi:hypothetical protein